MSDRFCEAVALAARLHRGQRRKGNGNPYLSHLLGVAALVMEAGGDEDECIAALLHDAVEDQGGAATARLIRRRFGVRVAQAVEECTEDRSAGQSWKDRKSASVRRVAQLTPSALLVLSADKLHNARSLAAAHREAGSGVWNRFHGGRDGTLWYYRAMADAIVAAGGGPLAGELEEAVRDLERTVRSGEPVS